MSTLDWVQTNVCISPAMTTDKYSRLMLQPWSVPRCVVDVVANSGGDGKVFETTAQPGKLMIDQQVSWANDSPLQQSILIRVTRGSRSWVTSNPNAIQIRDRWSYVHDGQPDKPITSGLFNGQLGSAIDLGTNSVAEPNPGRQWMWMDAHSSDEWDSDPLDVGSTFALWYQAYMWTPPPWSDNANHNSPQHSVAANFTRIQLWAFPIWDTAEGLALQQ